MMMAFCPIYRDPEKWHDDDDDDGGDDDGDDDVRGRDCTCPMDRVSARSILVLLCNTLLLIDLVRTQTS
jgi:hypothetical protein